MWNKGTALRELKKYPEALEVYQTLLKKDPSDKPTMEAIQDILNRIFNRTNK